MRAIVVAACVVAMGCGRVDDGDPTDAEIPDDALPLDLGLSDTATPEDAAADVVPCPDASWTTIDAPEAAVDDAELPSLGFRVAAPMHVGRVGHSTAVLPDGRLLVAGGYIPYEKDIVRDVEVYDEHTDQWTVVATVPSVMPSVFTLIPMGDRVAFVGPGHAFSWSVATGTFTELASPPNDNRLYVRKLPDGRWFALAETEGHAYVYTPSSDTWTPHGGYAGHPMWVVPLDDGRVATASDIYLIKDRVVNVYDSRTDSWSVAVAPFVPELHTPPIALPGGRLLVAGEPSRESGDALAAFHPTPFAILGTSPSKCEVWSTTSWLPRTASRAASVRLPSSKVLYLADMHVSTSSNTTPNVAAVYDDATASWSLYQPLPLSVFEPPTIDVLPSGKVVVAGGTDSCGATCASHGRTNVWVIDSPP